MIFRIDHTSFCNWDNNQIPILLWSLVRHHHLIDCEDSRVREEIKECFKGNMDVNLMCRKLFEITDEQRQFFTTINVSQYKFDQLLLLAGERSRILIENGPYEWPIYESLSLAYKKDPEYGNIFNYIKQAIDTHDLVCLHGGGITTFDALIELEEKTCYPGSIFALKHVVVFDRDTSAGNEYDPNRNILFNKFCEKESNAVGDNDVYTLNQTPYIWHVWYKRAIENYFSNDRYEQQHVDTRKLPREQNNRDYCKIGDYLGNVKKVMKSIAKGMTMGEFESHLHKFRVKINDEERELSEFQLLLLKIARII